MFEITSPELDPDVAATLVVRDSLTDTKIAPSHEYEHQRSVQRARGMSEVSLPLRRCLACNAVEPIGTVGPLWPIGWQCAACGHAVGQAEGIPMFAPELADTISGMDPRSFEATLEA